MTPDELRPILTAYRRQVEKAWTKATAHPDYDGADVSPVGQCGVTSAWLQRRLREDHGIGSTFCGGHVWLFNRCVADDHCWLEIGDGPHRTVVDLTASQIRGLESWEIVCSTECALPGGVIFYRAHRWPSLAELDVDGEFAPRIALLAGALS